MKMGNHLDAQGQAKIVNHPLPTAGTDSVNKDYVDTAVGTPFAADFGDGATLAYPFVHGFGTLDVHVTVFDKSTGLDVLVDRARTDVNTVTVTYVVGLPPGVNAHRVLIKKN